MNKEVLSFSQKLQLFKDLRDYFKTPREKSDVDNIKSIKERLEKWGRELKIRQNYYDL